MNQVSAEITQASSDRKWLAPFFTLWGGQAVSLLGSQLVQFSLVWWLTQTTGSATVLALATLVAMLPQIVLGPIAGALVDRWSRRLVMMVADSLSALAVLVLAFLFWTGQVQVWHVYLLMFLRSVAGAFHWPAMQASTSLMVPREHLSRIQGLNQMLNGLMNIGAAPLGALLLGLLPMQAILSIDVITALIAVLPLFFIAVPQPTKQPSAANEAQENTSLVQDLKAGFRYVYSWPGLLIISLMATVINLLLTPSSSLQPILVTRYFSGGAIHLAWMESAWGVGVVVGGLTLGAWGGFRRRIVTSMLGLILLGATIGAVGLVPPQAFWLAVLLIFLCGFSNPIVNGPLFAVVQAVVAPNMQGRVFTLIASLAAAMSPLGLIVAGPLADRLGVQVWYLIGGLLTILIGLAAFFIPSVMNIESHRQPAETLSTPAEDQKTALAAPGPAD
jgi:DHA3 family macrolide efflux protein-like MFS transporter